MKVATLNQHIANQWMRYDSHLTSGAFYIYNNYLRLLLILAESLDFVGFGCEDGEGAARGTLLFHFILDIGELKVVKRISRQFKI